MKDFFKYTGVAFLSLIILIVWCALLCGPIILGVLLAEYYNSEFGFLALLELITLPICCAMLEIAINN